MANNPDISLSHSQNSYGLVPATARSLCLRAITLWFFESWKTKFGRDVRHDNAKRLTAGLFYFIVLPSPDAFCHFFWIFRRLRSSLMNAIYIFSEKTSSDWVCIFMKHNRAKCRFPILKNQGEKMIPVQSKLFPRVLQEPNTLF